MGNKILNLTLLVLFASSFAACTTDDPGANASSFLGAQVQSKTTNAFKSVANKLTNGVPICNTAGEPNSGNFGDSHYSERHLHCSLKTNNGISNTLLGNLEMGVATVCALDKITTLTFNPAETKQANLSLSSSNLCFVNISDTFNLSVNVYSQSLAGSDWDRKIRVENIALSKDIYTIYLKDSDDKIGLRFSSYNNTNDDWDINTIVIDEANGIVRNEIFDHSNERHARLFVEGTLSATGAFTTITEAQYVLSYSEGTIIYDANTSNYEVQSFNVSGVEDTISPECTGSCAGLGLSYHAEFRNFSSNDAALDAFASDDTGLFLGYTTNLNLSMFFQ